MLISEIYCSRQGEGLLTGTPSLFVRTSGCNLRCGFCDTPFASWKPEGEQLSVDQIMGRVFLALDAAPEKTEHVVITGGEPLLPANIIDLCKEISQSGLHITIETAGTIHRTLDCDLVSISPKLSNSDPDQGRAGGWLQKHRSARHRPEIVRMLMSQHAYQIKFVVNQPEDLDEILEYLDQIRPFQKSQVLLMPQGIDQAELESRERWMVPICETHGFTFCPRRHIQWYGNRRGT